MQMLISQSFIKHGVIFLQPLMSEILEKWFARIHKTKRSKRLCIGQLMEQFFKDENGVIYVIKMRCLKHRVGLTTVMEDTTNHLPDIGIFKIPEFIDGPHELLPLRGKIDTHLTRYVLLKISEKHQVLMEKH